MSKIDIETPVSINTDDLTLDELDRANRLVSDGTCGNVAALAFVWLKRSHPGVRMADVKQLHQRDVIVTDDAEQAEQDGASTAADPTN